MADIGQVFPGTNERITDKIPAPTGGFWLLGERGGVFAEGGAPHFGSYFSIPEGDRNDPNRRFRGISQTASGGYALTSTTGERYAFEAPPAQPTPAPPVAPAPTAAELRAASPAGKSARATILDTLKSYGLPESLVNTLWDTWFVAEDKPVTQILLDLRTTPEFKTRFPGIAKLEERRNRGEAVYVPTPVEYLDLEVGIASLYEDAELPAGFYDDPSDFAEIIGGSNSPKEVQDRIDLARQMAFKAPVAAREEMSRLYDVSPGELVAMFLDLDKALPIIEQRIAAAGVAGAAKQTGFGLLTRQEAEAMAGTGLTGAAAVEGFGAAAALSPLTQETAEEAEDIGRAEQLGFVTGEAGATKRLRARQAARVARFQGGGGASGIGGPSSGLGTAD